MSDLTREVKFKISLQQGANVEEALLAIKKALTESEREYVKFNTTLSKNEGGNTFITATTKSTAAVQALREELKKLQSDQGSRLSNPLIRDLLEVSAKDKSALDQTKAIRQAYLQDHAQGLRDNAALDLAANRAHSQALRDNAAIDQKELARQRERNDSMRKLLADELNVYSAYTNATRAARARATEVSDSVGSSANTLLTSARAASEREIALARHTADSIEGIKLRQSIRLEEIEARTQNKILEYQRRAAEASLTGNNRAAALIPGNVAATVTSNITQTNRVNDTAAQEIVSLQARTRAYEEAQRQMLSAMNSRIQMEQTILQHGANSEQTIVQRSMQEQIRLREELRARIAQINSTATPNTYAADQARITDAMRVTERAINANNVATRDQINTLRELSPQGSTGGNLLSFIAQWGVGWRIVNSVINAVSSAIHSIPTAGIEMQSTISTLHASFSNNQDGTRSTAQGEALTAIAMTKIQEEAKRTGIALTTLEQNYRTFLASAHMAGESTATVNTIFKDLNTVTAALHMSGDRAQLTFLALSQMFNKGKVQSEELTKQLGNLLPGAFAAFAKATGRTTQQLTQDMKAGTVTAHENIAKFISFYASQYGDAFSKASAGLNAELGRLSSAWTNFSRGVFGGTGEVMADTVRGLTSLVESVTISGAQMEKFGQQVKSVGIAFGAAGIAGAIAVIVSSPMILGLTAVAAAMAGIAKAVGMISDAKERDAKIGYGVQGVDDTYSGQSVEEQLKNKADAIAKVTNERNTLTNNKALFTPEETAQIEKLNHTLYMLGLQYTALGQKVSEYLAINNTTAEFDSEMEKEHDAITKAIHPEVAAYEKLIATLGSLEKAQRLVVESNTASIEQWSKDPSKPFPALKSDVLAPGESDTILADAHQKLLQKATTELETQQKAGNDRRKVLLDTNLANIKDNADRQVAINETLASDLKSSYDSGLIGLEEYIAQNKKLLEDKARLQLQSISDQKASLASTISTMTEQSLKELPTQQIQVGINTEGMSKPLADFVGKYGESIAKVATQLNAPVRAITAQLALETRYGQAVIKDKDGTSSNNLGNIKEFDKAAPGVWAYDKITKTWDKYKVFEDAGESLVKYVSLLNRNWKGALNTTTTEDFVAGLRPGQKGGYAEDTNYLKKIKSIADTIPDTAYSISGGSLKSHEELLKLKQQALGLTTKTAEVQSKLASDERKQHADNLKLYQDDIRAQADKFKPITLPSTFGNEVKNSAETFTQEVMDGMHKQGASFIEGWKANMLAAGIAVRDEYNRIHEAIPVAEKQLAQDKNNGVVDAAGYDRAKVAIQGMRDALEPLKQSLTDLGEANKIAGKTAEDWAEQQTKAVNEVIGSAEKQLNREISRATMSDSQSFIEEKRNQLKLRGVEIGVKEEKQLQHVLALQQQLLAVQQEQAVISSLKNGFIQGFKDILSGASDFGTSFKKIFDDAVNVILNNSLQNLVNGIQNAFNSLSSGGNINWGGLVTSVIGVAASAVASWVTSSPKQSAPSLAQTSTNPNLLGRNQLGISDAAGREVSYVSSVESLQRFNIAVNTTASLVRTFSSALSDYTVELFSTLASDIFGSSLTSAVSSFTSSISSAYTSLTNMGDTLLGGVKGLVTTATDYITSFGSTTAANTANTASTASTASTNSVGSSLGTLTAYAGAALSIIQLGYNLYEIAGQKYSTTLEKVSQSLEAASMAAAAVSVAVGVATAGIAATLGTIASAIPVVGWIVAAALHVAAVVVEGVSGDWGRSFSNGFGGAIGTAIWDAFFRKDPSATILSTTSPDTSANKVRDTAGDYYTSSGGKSGSVSVDTQFGQVSLRLNEISRKSDLVIQEAVSTFLPLLRVIKTFDEALASSIKAVDTMFGQETLSKFKITAEHEQPLDSLDTSKFVSERLTDIAKGLGETGTKAGEAVAVWWGAFSKGMLDPTKGQKYNSQTAFNIEAFLALELPKLAQLPTKLANLFVASVTSVADGATQEQFTGQMNDFFAGWQIAEQGLKSIGLNIEQTSIPDYLASLTGLGMTVLESSKSLVAYASTFKGAGENASKEFTAAFDKLFSDATATGQNKQRTSGYLSSYITLSTTATDLGLKATNAELDSLATKLNNAADQATLAANAVIDKAIADNNLAGVTRDSAMQTLVLQGTLKDSDIAAASFSKALVAAQQEMFAGISGMKDLSTFLETSLDSLGFTFVDVANVGNNVTATFKDMASAMAWADTIFKAAFSPEEYARRSQSVAQAAFTSAAKQLGLGANYTTQDYTQNIDKNVTNAFDPKLGAAGNAAYKQLGDAFATLTEKTQTYTQAVNTVTQADTSGIDAAKQLASIQEDINKQLYALAHTELENSLQGARDEIENLTLSAQEAGGAVSGLDTLLQSKLGAIAKSWITPLTDQFKQLGKSDLQNTLESTVTKFNELNVEAETLSSAGLVDLTTTLNGLNQLKLDELRNALNPLQEELAALGSTKYTISMKGVDSWYKETLAISDNIALAYGTDGKTAIAWIDQIKNARIAALNEEHTKIMADATEANANFQTSAYKQDAPDASSLATSLLSLRSGLLANITSLIQAGGSYSDVMQLISYATTVGTDQIASAQANIAARYKGIFNTIQAASDAMAKMAIQARLTISPNGQTNQAELDRQIEDYNIQAALKQLHDEDFNIQMTGMNALISLQQNKFDKERAALQASIDFVQTLRDHVKSLLLNANLSPLTNKQRLDEAQKQAYATLKAASSSVDDKARQDARSQLTSKVDAYLAEAKAYYASSPEYAKIFDEVTGALNGFGDVTVDPQKQLVELNSQMLSALTVGNDMLAAILEAQKVKQEKEVDSIPVITQKIVDGFNISFQGLLDQFKLKPEDKDTASLSISRLISKVFTGLEDLLEIGKISPEVYTSVKKKEETFIQDVLRLFEAGTISEAAYSSLLIGRETLNFSLIKGLKAGTMDTGEVGRVYDARNTVSESLSKFLHTASLTSENINDILTGFGSLSANANYMLAGVTMTPEQLALISEGYGLAARGAGDTIGSLGLTPAQTALVSQGAGLFSQNVSKEVGNIKTPSTALTIVQTGITTMAETIKVGLSDITFLMPARDTVLAGVNGLAFNIYQGLIHVTDGVDPSPISNAINTVIAQVAAVIATQQVVTTLTPTSSTPGLDAILKGDMTTAAALATASGLFTPEDIASFLAASRPEQLAIFDRLPKFANGGIANSQSMYVAGEVREAIIPIPSGSVRAQITEPRQVGLTREELAQEVAKLIKELQRSAGSNEEGQDATVLEIGKLKDAMEVLNNKIERILSE
jgi:tape measure domain-containing protein